MSSSPTAQVSAGPRPALTPGAPPHRDGKVGAPDVDRPPRCERHAGAATGARRDGSGRFAGEGVDDCTTCSSLSRSHRRRRRRERQRDLARRAGDPHRMAVDCAQQILKIADDERDPAMRRALYRVARAYHMRADGDEHKQRMAVLGVLEKVALVTVDDLVEKTLLPVKLIRSFLDEWASAEVDLVFITTMEGKRKCGRGGTTLYYGLRK